MLHRHPLIGRALSLLILTLYLAGMYFGWQFFLATPESTFLLKPFDSISSATGHFGSRSDYSQRIYSTGNGGQSWQLNFTDKTNYLDTLYCSGSLDCVVLGTNFDGSPDSYSDYVINLVTADAGQHWDTIHPKIKPLSGGDENDILTTSVLSCPVAKNCFILVETDTTGLASTTDGGKTWNIVNEDISYEALNALSCVSLTLCNAVGQDGLILHSSDGGKNWSVQKSNTDGTLYYLDCSPTGFCLALGRAGLTTASEDGGLTWVKKSSAPLKNSIKLTCTDESTCYSLGYSDSNYKLEVTRDRGGSWELLNNAPKKGVTDLSCPADNTCFISTYQNGVSFTNDGGKTWTSQEVDKNISVAAISCFDKSTCFLVATPDSR